MVNLGDFCKKKKKKPGVGGDGGRRVDLSQEIVFKGTAPMSALAQMFLRKRSKTWTGKLHLYNERQPD